MLINFRTTFIKNNLLRLQNLVRQHLGKTKGKLNVHSDGSLIIAYWPHNRFSFMRFETFKKVLDKDPFFAGDYLLTTLKLHSKDIIVLRMYCAPSVLPEIQDYFLDTLKLQEFGNA